MSLHDRAIDYVAKILEGKRNDVPMLFSVDTMIVPDIISGSMDRLAEVEVANHKFTPEFLMRYREAIIYQLPRRRPATSLWFILPNYKNAKAVFDDVHVLGQTSKNKFVELREFQ